MLNPEVLPIILAHEPAASSGIDDTSNAVNLEGAAGCLILVVEYTAGGDTDLVLTVHEGATAAVAEAGTYAISATFPIWVAADASSTTAATALTWERQTDAATYTIDATTTKNYMVAFYIPAGILTNGRPYIQLGTSGGNASNYAVALYFLDKARYQGATLYDVIS
jgi:hypothetical protein